MTAMITGGSRGIGAACCKALALAGHDVAFSYQSNAAAAAETVAIIEAQGRKALAFQGDMAKETDIRSFFSQTQEDFGTPEAIVLNAGITGPYGRLEERTKEEIQAVIDLNVVGVLLAAKEAIACLSTKNGGKGGSLVLLSSAAAWLGSADEFIAYAASKGAIQTATIGLAREVAREGIRVNAVAPGLIDTDIHASSGVPDRVNLLANNVPMGRGGTAEDVAEAILWLLSDKAKYVTGTILPVSGGR